MSFGPRSIAKAAASCSKASTRASSSSSTSTLPPLRASLILSRQPLLTRPQHPLEEAYHTHNRNLRHALSNPLPEHFYFREGSLPHRRYQHAEWQYLKETYGPVIAGPEPSVGEIPPEREHEEMPRDHWEQVDAERGERSLERKPEEEVFCLVQTKEGNQWTFPEIVLGQGETLDGAIESRITGTNGWFDGKTMDTWLVTKKPIGMIKKGKERTYFLKSHILAGEPRLTKDAPWKSYAWLTKSELQARLSEQKQNQWEDVRPVFGARD
ncbi:hypothetical protein DB88DRAFT_478955 [Papiliotrema laurentii]|uniref:Large ribosomal subunit protein mL46 N-terminal domain-containing protein n=1 Tax=Papiliotrema laurentii TaxID=5418 RepID=A0AAD9FWV9_PAPLA|nr:hypothetical protein DB88DRAFT_478955 [Papiliotrema laurentii]